MFQDSISRKRFLKLFSWPPAHAHCRSVLKVLKAESAQSVRATGQQIEGCFRIQPLPGRSYSPSMIKLCQARAISEQCNKLSPQFGIEASNLKFTGPKIVAFGPAMRPHTARRPGRASRPKGQPLGQFFPSMKSRKFRKRIRDPHSDRDAFSSRLRELGQLARRRDSADVYSAINNELKVQNEPVRQGTPSFDCRGYSVTKGRFRGRG